MKKIYVIIISCLIALTSVTPVNSQSVGVANVMLNGVKVRLERDPLIKNNRMLVPAKTVLNKLGGEVSWFSKSGLIKMSEGSTAIAMSIGKKSMTVNDSSNNMDVAPLLIQGTVMVPISYVAKALNINIRWDAGSKTVYLDSSSKGGTTQGGGTGKQFVVVIDPGHGGYETGASSAGLYEKDLNLDIAKKLNILLQDAGIKTYMTRTDDSYVDLYDRSGLANNVNADLFICIHNNADLSSKTTGTMSLYYPLSGHSKGNLTAKRFADIVENELTGDLVSKNLGIVERPHLAVLRTTKMPAVLAEVGYMTNKSELEKLTTSDYQQKSAEALKKAVVEALNEIG
jgi:N-acetylmuramoyl-L-alanine amidase